MDEDTLKNILHQHQLYMQQLSTDFMLLRQEVLNVMKENEKNLGRIDRLSISLMETVKCTQELAREVKTK